MIQKCEEQVYRLFADIYVQILAFVRLVEKKF